MRGSWLKNFILCTWKERFWFADSKNTKISIFIKIDLGLFKNKDAIYTVNAEIQNLLRLSNIDH